MRNPFHSSDASNPYNVNSGGGWQNPGASLARRVTDPGTIIRIVLCCLLLGLAAFLLVRAVPGLRILLGGTTATGVVDARQFCGTGRNPTERASIVFLDRQGNEHFVTTGCNGGFYSVGDRVTVYYLAADPDAGGFTGEDNLGTILLTFFGSVAGLVSMILLVRLLLRLKWTGIRQLSPATLITTLVLITLVTGTLYVTRPGQPNKTSYRHYQIGEAVTVEEGWSVTIKGVQSALPGLNLSKSCLVVDATFRNPTNQKQFPNVGDFSLYPTTSTSEGDPFTPCDVPGISSISNGIAPGGTEEGQFAFQVPGSVHQFWLAYSSPDEESRSVWDIAVAPSTPPSIGYHHLGETVAVQGLWDVTIKSAHPAQIGRFSPPLDGSICLDIDVSMQNISGQVLELNDLQFQLYDTQGNANSVPCSLSFRHLNGSVAAGGMAQGEVAFEAPASEKEFLLAFQAQTGCGYQCPAPTVWDFQGGAADTSGDHHVGETVNVQGLWSVIISNPKLTLVGVQRPPQSGETCLFVQVSVKNSSSQQSDLLPTQFLLYDAQGEQLPTPCDFAAALVGTSLAPGDTAQGVIVFGVPTSDNQFRLAFQAQLNCEPDCAELDIWTIGIG